MNLNNILLSLEILNQIKENDKIAIQYAPGEKKMYVDRNSFLLSARRWYNGFNREDSIKYIETLYNDIENTTNYIINGNHLNEGELLVGGIKKGISGLENLKNTYIDDSVISSKIKLIIDKLNTLIKNLLNANSNTIESIQDISIQENLRDSDDD